MGLRETISSSLNSYNANNNENATMIPNTKYVGIVLIEVSNTVTNMKTMMV